METPRCAGTTAPVFTHPDDRIDLYDRWDSKGCVVLHRYEHPIDVNERPGIWSEERRAGHHGNGRAGIVGMYADRTTRRGVRYLGQDRSQAESVRRSHGVALVAPPLPVGRMTSEHYRAKRQVRSDVRRIQREQGSGVTMGDRG